MDTRDLKVLVVDDDFRVASIHADIVAAAPGFAVQGSVRTLAEARGAITTRAPDLLLADVYLPDGNGIDLVQSSGLDAFVLSAAAEPSSVRRALAVGVHAYLVKPFTRHALTERLERFARFRGIMDTPHQLTQRDIDKALSQLHGSSQPVSAAGSATEQLVLESLDDQERSAAEVAELTGVSRATAQRRLAAMAGRGVVNVRLRYGSSGRPEHLYARSAGSGW
ncbi:MAG: response regulator [Mycobacteriaceae bacterium]|uniref:response regulator n=1 Tax=Corynebacterium sp. TaxID=1720 RepID=UPI003F987919